MNTTVQVIEILLNDSGVANRVRVSAKSGDIRLEWRCTARDAPRIGDVIRVRLDPEEHT